MTDRELLEKAARAAGIEYCTKPNVPQYPDMLTLETEKRFWRPLDDDGDALRLAAALYIDLDYYKGYGEVWAHPYNSDTPGIAVVEFTDDRAADTRRAIVRAAAAMGDAS